MIPVYNCSQFLPEALESVLVQALTAADMQIEVVDDASTDTDVEALVQRVGKGRIHYFRQAHNVGSLRNFETCINRSRGRLVHLLHGDDRIRPGFYEELGHLLNQYPEAGAGFCRFGYMNESGQRLYDHPIEAPQPGLLPDWLLKISQNNRIQYAAIAVKREVYEQLGSFYGITYGEDWEMWVRIARNYPIAYTPHILADYRRHSNSISGNKHAYGEYFLDLELAMSYIQQHIPVHQRQELLKKSRAYHSHYGMYTAEEVWHTAHNRKMTLSFIKQLLHMHKDYKLYGKVAKLLVKMAINYY
ncbi:glycosyltransferase family 2 protein [Hymenobacter telluris]|nr:glycosyltransferase [Hymenobacter telluris]